MSRARGILGAALLALLVPAASAEASSLVYIKGGNVFVADADGGHPHQVTGSGGFRSPSESDNGTIVAAKGGSLYRMRQNGELLGRPVAPDSGGYPLDPRVSPDGNKALYWFDSLTSCTIGPDSCGVQSQPGSDFAGPDGRDPYGRGSQTNEQAGGWMDNATVVLGSHTSYLDYQVVGHTAQRWFDPGSSFSTLSFPAPYEPVASRSGNYLAVDLRNSRGVPSSDDRLAIFQTTAAPPAQPDALCDIGGSAGGFKHPAIAPDDQSVWWQDTDGLHQASVDFTNVCAGGAELGLSGDTLAIPGATEPSFGAAANNPPPRTSPAFRAGLSAPRKVKRAGLSKHGLRVRISCTGRCSYGVLLGAHNATARALRLTRRRHGDVLLGSQTGLASGGTATATVRPTSQAKRALKRIKRRGSAALVLELRAQDASGHRVTRDYKLTVTA